MEKSKTEKSGIRPGVIVVVVAVLGLVIAGRLLGRRGGKTNEPEPGSVAATAPATSASTPATTPARAPGSPGGQASAAAPGLPSNGLKPPRTVGSSPLAPGAVPGTGAGTAESTEPTADWSAKLDDILGSNDDESKKADLLLAMWKTLPEDGQVEIMQHISNLLPDEKFPALAQTFTNASTPEAVLDIIMTDTLNRPNGIKLPVLLDVARTPGHPKAEEARDILEVFVDADHGSDWAKWEKAVKDWLKENPDEPEGTN